MFANHAAATQPVLGLTLIKYVQHKQFFKPAGVKFAGNGKEKQAADKSTEWRS